MNEIEQGELNQQLFNAVEEGDENKVRKLLDLGSDVNAVGEDGMTPLHLAAENGHEKIAKILIAKGANVDAEDEQMNTPLQLAAQGSSILMIKILIKAGADTDTMNTDDDNPLYTAVQYGHFRYMDKIVDTIIQYTLLLDPEATELHYLEWSDKLKYWDNCKDEVEEMQNEKIGNSDVSLCKFLLETDPNKLAGCVYDINIEGLKDKYPTYADMIKSQYDKGMERRALLLSSEEVIKHHFSKGDATPKYLTERFAETASSILTDKDVKNLRKLQDKKDEKVLFSKGAQALQYCAAENGVTLPEDQARRLVETMMSSTLKDIDVKNLIKLTAPKIAQRPL